jgi:uncharacterized protein
MPQILTQRLADHAPDLERILRRGHVEAQSRADFAAEQIRRDSLRLSMRDGVRLATDVYLPPALPARTLVMRTPYGRAAERFVGIFLAFAQRGYVVVVQDCRGTGDSEPDAWDYCVYEHQDGIDCVEWIVRQDWFNGFLCSFGGSYVAMTQWCMSAHPRMSAIAPEVAGLRVTRSTVRQHMFVNGYPRIIGKGANRLALTVSEIERAIEAETMAGGYFNAPLPTPLPDALLERYPELRTMLPASAKRLLWSRLCEVSAPERVTLLRRLLGVSEFTYADYWSLPTIFDCLIPYGVHTIPSTSATELCQRMHAPALMIAAWYDWNLGDTLPTWLALRCEGRAEVAERSRLIITPAAHHLPGYSEGAADNPELLHDHRSNVDLLLLWYESVHANRTDSWPRVIYYLMGANEWRTASDWPVPEARQTALYLGADGGLSFAPPEERCEPDRYRYDPTDPTPTIGGSILSFLYPTGSVDVSAVQRRDDVLTYTTAPLEHDLDVVGPLRLILYSSSSAVDTDFSGRLSDVLPDGRALQLQSGILRARYRNLVGDPELLQPERIYRFEIDLWATANRFKAGHCLRLDISSADFPRFDRNTNRGGQLGDPVPAQQAIFHDREHPSHLLLCVMNAG